MTMQELRGNITILRSGLDEADIVDAAQYADVVPFLNLMQGMRAPSIPIHSIAVLHIPLLDVASQPMDFFLSEVEILHPHVSQSSASLEPTPMSAHPSSVEK